MELRNHDPLSSVVSFIQMIIGMLSVGMQRAMDSIEASKRHPLQEPKNNMYYAKNPRRLWLTTLALLAFLHLSVFTAYRVSKTADTWSDLIPEASIRTRSSETVVQQRLSSKRIPSLGRAIYPNSVIRGGVRSPEELRAALVKDRVVAAHFSDFSATSSRIVTLKADKAAYVSYRVKDKVYWTKKKVRLAKGEELITDGINYARSRCGNRISEVSQSPTSAEEPSHAMLDTPVPADDRDPLLLAAMPKPAATLPEQTPPLGFGFVPPPRSDFPGFVIPGIIGGGAVAGRAFNPSGGSRDIPVPPIVDSSPSPLPKADVPEPSTLLFLASGLGTAIALRRRLR
jgi:hypothetical protein